MTSEQAGYTAVPVDEQETLLRTKLGVSSPRPGLVPRPDLLDVLDRGSACRLVLISAPAGFGKTTLLSHWLAERKHRAGWLALEAADNDPTRFGRYILAAAQPLLDDAYVRSLLDQPHLDPSALTTILVNGLSATRGHAALVLDDYHVITAPAVHDLVASLLDHLPAQVQLILLTRADPPLPLALLRARGQLLEIRANRLRFSTDESAAFLNGTMGLRLGDAEVASLTERTEGWAVGLQLAALSLHGRSDVGPFIAAFTGSHRFVLDYLLEEVLERQPPEVQQFLLETSILERLSAELCEAVTNKSGAQSHLVRLERANLFLVALDEERHWYRYHHLFADCLQAKLRWTDPGLLPRLHRRAAEWYATSRSKTEAVEHALRADDPAYAAGLVEGVGFDLLARSEFATVRRWLEALAAENVERSPSLCVFFGWVFLEAFLVNRAKRWLDLPGDADLPPHLRLLRAALQARLRWLHGEPGQARTLVSTDLFDLGPVEDPAIPSPGVRGYLVLYASAQLAEALRLQGQLRQAGQTYREALRRTENVDPDARLLAARSFAELGLGRLLYEQDELEAAEQHLTNGTELARRAGNEQYAAWGAMFLPPLRQAQGRSAEALVLIDQAEESARRRGVEVEVAWCAAQRARLARMQGDLEAVAAWAEAYQPSVDDEAAGDAPLGYIEEFTEATRARALLALGRADEAARLIERLLARAAVAGQAGHTIELLALAALASQAKGDTTRALGILEKSLALAEPEGYVRTFAEEGEPLARLLTEGGHRWSVVGAAYVRQLLAATGPRASDGQLARSSMASDLVSTPRGRSASLVEPLTPRELEVLQLVSAGQSNRQIAASLVISLNTAKTHVHALCGKLGAESRSHAVARARELGLLR